MDLTALIKTGVTGAFQFVRNAFTGAENKRHHLMMENFEKSKQQREYAKSIQDEIRKSILDLQSDDVNTRILAVAILMDNADKYVKNELLENTTEKILKEVSNIVDHLCRYIRDNPDSSFNDALVRQKIFSEISSRIDKDTLKFTKNNREIEILCLPSKNPWTYIEYNFENSKINYPLSNIKLANANFNNSDFLSEISFKNSNFYGLTEFESARFYCDPDFVNTVFHGPVNFEWARFKEDEKIEQRFTFESHFHKGAIFKHVHFEDTAVFSRSHFYQDTDFTLTQFYKTALFEYTEFKEKANFLLAEFRGNVIFNYAKFHSECNKTNFSGTILGAEDSEVSFREATFKIAPDFSNSYIFGIACFYTNIYTDLIITPIMEEYSRKAGYYTQQIFQPYNNKQPKADSVFENVNFNYTHTHRFDFYNLGSYTYQPGKATIILKNGQSVTREIPAGSYLFDPNSWDKRIRKSDCRSEPAKPLDESD